MPITLQKINVYVKTNHEDEGNNGEVVNTYIIRN